MNQSVSQSVSQSIPTHVLQFYTPTEEIHGPLYIVLPAHAKGTAEVRCTVYGQTSKGE